MEVKPRPELVSNLRSDWIIMYHFNLLAVVDRVIEFRHLEVRMLSLKHDTVE